MLSCEHRARVLINQGVRESMIDPGAIKSVTICSSSKFYATAKRVAGALDEKGLAVFTPRFEYDEEVVTVSPDEKMKLTHEFLEKISRSDAIYVIDEGGYTGQSVCIEIGYASALGKTVILSEPPAEGAVMALTDAVVSAEEFPSALVCGL